MENKMETTAVNSLLETLLPFIDRTKVSDTFLHTVTEVHLAMEKEQIKDAYMLGRKGGTIKDFNETFKSE